MLVRCKFKGQEIEVEKEKCYPSLNFNGCFLVEIDKDLVPTGRAIDRYGYPVKFNADELIIEEVK